MLLPHEIRVGQRVTDLKNKGVIVRAWGGRIDIKWDNGVKLINHTGKESYLFPVHDPITSLMDLV